LNEFLQAASQTSLLHPLNSPLQSPLRFQQFINCPE